MNRWEIQLAIALLLGVAGQLFMKEGAAKLPALNSGILGFAGSILTNPAVLSGLLLYGVSTLFWLSILRRQELSLVYPLLSLSYILVLISSALFFKEQITWGRGLGTLLVLLGVFLITR